MNHFSPETSLPLYDFESDLTCLRVSVPASKMGQRSSLGVFVGSSWLIGTEWEAARGRRLVHLGRHLSA